MKNNLADRIDFLLHGRKIHNWGISIGLSRSVLSRLNQGIFPGAEKLIPAIRAENLSLSWLLEGVGAPYLVHHCHDDAECAAYLAELQAERGWKTHILCDGNSLALVLTQPGSYQVDGVDYLYTIVEVVSGPLNVRTLAQVGAYANDHNTFWCDVKAGDMQRLRRGEVGSWGLLHAADALLNAAVAMSRDEAQTLGNTDAVAELRETYQPEGVGGVSTDEMAFVESIRRLNPENLAHIRAVVRALAHATNNTNHGDSGQ